MRASSSRWRKDSRKRGAEPAEDSSLMMVSARSTDSHVHTGEHTLALPARAANGLHGSACPAMNAAGLAERVATP
jgi:hypothetical protein